MLRPSPRAILRPQLATCHLLARRAAPSARRNISFAPPSQKPRSFKNYLARCAIAGGAVWWYMNTDVFAEEGGLARKQTPISYSENQQMPTVDELAESRKQRREAAAAAASASTQVATNAHDADPTAAQTTNVADAAAELEDEAGEQGAFNEETGEINWDCPCLGGMAHGPCGPEFREAFSCFVYSKEDPKGVDCIDRFKNMQECFRQHPDVYGAELAEEEDEEDELAAAALAEAQIPEQDASTSTLPPSSSSSSTASNSGEGEAQATSPPSVSHPTPVAVREKPEQVRTKQLKEAEEQVRDAPPASTSSSSSTSAVSSAKEQKQKPRKDT